MKTIEQLLKPVILAAIQEQLDNAADAETYENSMLENVGYDLRLANDVNFQDKTATRYTIPAVIITGQGTRSDVPGIVAMQTTVQCIFTVEANYVQKFLALLNQYCSNVNGISAAVTDTCETDETTDDIDYTYILRWGFAMASGSPYSVTAKKEYDQNIRTETITVMQVVLAGTVTFTSELALQDEKLYLYLDTGEDLQTYVWETCTQAQYEALYPEDQYSGLVLPDESEYTYPSGFMLIDIEGTPIDFYRLILGPIVDIYDYIEIIGVQMLTEDLQPIVNSVSPINAYKPILYVSSETQSLVIKFYFKPGNIAHEYIKTLFFQTNDVTSYDITYKRVITSLGITQTGLTGKISNLHRELNSDWEIISFTLTRE